MPSLQPTPQPFGTTIFQRSLSHADVICDREKLIAWESGRWKMCAVAREQTNYPFLFGNGHIYAAYIFLHNAPKPVHKHHICNK